MAWYKAGTVGVTNGATAVVLSGGDALGNIFAGDTFKGPDGRDYEIAQVTSASGFTLAKPYQGATASGQAYAIQPTASSGALRLLLDQVSDLVTNYQVGRDAWSTAPTGTLKGRKSAGVGAVESLGPADVLALLTSGSAATALAGSELLPMQQGSGAVKATANQLLSRAAGQKIPFDIGSARAFTISDLGVGIGTDTISSLGSAIPTLHIKSTATSRAGGVKFSSYDSSLESAIYAADGSLEVTSLTSHPIIFRTSNIYRGQWDTDGNFLVGNTTANLGLNNKAIGVTLSPVGFLKLTRNESSLVLHRTDTNGAVALFVRDQTGVGSISVTTSATSYSTSSDYRLKDEEGEISEEDALAFIDQSRPIWFRWKSTGERVDGYLAHEVQAYAPNAVTGEKDAVEEIGDAVGYRERDPETGAPNFASKETLSGITRAEAPEGYEWTKTGERPVYQGIDQSKLVPRLNAGLKAAVRLIRSQAGEIDALKQRIEALEAAA